MTAPDKILIKRWSWAQFHNNSIQLKFNPNLSDKSIQISDKRIRNVKNRIFRLPMHLHKHQVYSLEQHSQSEIWSAIIRINSEGKSLIMIIGPGKLLFLWIYRYSWWFLYISWLKKFHYTLSSAINYHCAVFT